MAAANCAERFDDIDSLADLRQGHVGFGKRAVLTTRQVAEKPKKAS